MKICEKCGIEIGTKDGENRCEPCDVLAFSLRMKKLRAKQRRERADIMQSLGLVKVRGALGGTYWE